MTTDMQDETLRLELGEWKCGEEHHSALLFMSTQHPNERLCVAAVPHNALEVAGEPGDSLFRHINVSRARDLIALRMLAKALWSLDQTYPKRRVFHDKLLLAAAYCMWPDQQLIDAAGDYMKIWRRGLAVRKEVLDIAGRLKTAPRSEFAWNLNMIDSEGIEPAIPSVNRHLRTKCLNAKRVIWITEIQHALYDKVALPLVTFGELSPMEMTVWNLDDIGELGQYGKALSAIAYLLYGNPHGAKFLTGFINQLVFSAAGVTMDQAITYGVNDELTARSDKDIGDKSYADVETDSVEQSIDSNRSYLGAVLDRQTMRGCPVAPYLEVSDQALCQQGPAGVDSLTVPVGIWLTVAKPFHLAGGWGQNWKDDGAALNPGDQFKLVSHGSPLTAAEWKVRRKLG